LSTGSAYKEGTFLTPFTTNTEQSYERKPGGSSGNCTDTNNNAADFRQISPSTPRDAASAGVAPTCQTATPTPTITPTPTATLTGSAPIPVIISSNAFNPQVITITHGSTVKWTNLDPTNHTVSSGTGGVPDNVFRSPTLAQNQTYSFTFNTVNTYQYFDEIQGAAMSGTVVVQ
jgi:plastocyanin